MPYSSQHQVFYGADAIITPKACQTILIAYIDEKINDAAGEFYAILNHAVVVTHDVEVAIANFKGGTPSIVITQGPSPSDFPSGKMIGGVLYRGQRREITLDLDMGWGVKLAKSDSPEKLSGDDETFGNVVRALIRKGVDDLEALGLFNVEIEADGEAQRNPRKRNPHQVTFFTKTLDNYSP